ncbi:MAG: hypothetical protein QXL82_03570 [Candidatus Aenigmatarchaeota archaeon]
MVIQNLASLVLNIVLIAILIGVGYTILGNFQATLQQQNQTVAAQNVQNTGNALNQVVAWIPTIIIIVIAVSIIGLVVGAFGRRRM